jgi:hypothetical protein
MTSKVQVLGSGVATALTETSSRFQSMPELGSFNPVNDKTVVPPTMSAAGSRSEGGVATTGVRKGSVDQNAVAGHGPVGEIPSFKAGIEHKIGRLGWAFAGNL